MNTIIAINWARNWIVVAFTDIENVYTFSLGKVTSLRGAKSRVRRLLFDECGIKISHMNLEKTTNAIDYFRSNRVEY